MAMEKEPEMKMYFLLNMGIFQPATCKFTRGYFQGVFAWMELEMMM